MRASKHLSVKSKLALSFLAVALIPLILLTLVNKQINQQSLTQNANQALLAAATETALNLDSLFKANLDAVRVEAQLPTLARYLNLLNSQRQGSRPEAEVSAVFRALSRRDPLNILSYSLLDLEGRNVMDTNLLEIGLDKSDQDYFQKTLQTGLPYISPMRAPKVVNDPASLYFSSPIWDAKGKIVGVLAVRYNATAVQQLIAQSNDLAGSKSFAILLDENHIRLAHGTNANLMFEPLVPLSPGKLKELIAAARLPNLDRKEPTSQLFDFEKALNKATCTQSSCPPIYLTTRLVNNSTHLYSLAVTRLKIQPWLIAFAQPQEVFLAPIEAQFYTALLLSSGIGLVAIAIAFFMGYQFAQPLVYLTNKVTQFTAGNLNVRAKIRSRDEMGVLASSFNTMAEQVGKLLQGLEERTNQLETSQNITFAISELLKVIREPNQLLQAATALLQSRFKLYQVQIYLLDEKNQQLFVQQRVCQTDDETKPNPLFIPLNCEQNSIAKAAHTLELVSISHINPTTDQIQQQGISALTRTQVAVPLISRSTLLGVLDIQDNQPERFSQNDLETFKTLAGQIATALENAHLFEALQQTEAQYRDKAVQLQQTLDKLQKMQAQLVHSEKMSGLGQLVAGVAHEINNPVNFIQGNLLYAREYSLNLLRLLQLYQTHYPNPPTDLQTELGLIDLEFIKEDLTKLLQSMSIGTDRIYAIVKSLRSFSRLDEAEVKAVDIHEGIDSTLVILGNRFQAKGNYPEIQVIKEYGNLPLVECYAGQLNQVFMNILTNAIDAFEEVFDSELKNPSSTQFLPTITIQTEVVDSQGVRVVFSDNGSGMSEYVCQHLFDPFFTTKPVGKGTGMGMSISYQIITEKHKGMLLCISSPGKGTKLVIEIPIKQQY